MFTHVYRAEFENDASEVNLGRAIGLQADGMISATVTEILASPKGEVGEFRSVRRESLALTSDYIIPDDRADMTRTKYSRNAPVITLNP